MVIGDLNPCTTGLSARLLNSKVNSLVYASVMQGQLNCKYADTWTIKVKDFKMLA
jgi:hypothetical protein